MMKKNLLLLCTLIAAYAPVADAKSKCCNCCSLTVSGSGSIGGSLSVGGSESVGGNLAVSGSETVGGSVTAASFILPSGDALFNGLRNWAVFSNQGAIVAPGLTTIPWDGTPAFTPNGISNLAGVITLPTSGIFLIMYTVRLSYTGEAGVNAAFLAIQQSTLAGGLGMTNITQAAVTTNTNNLAIAAGTLQETQISGYALITVTSALNNAIELRLDLPATGYTMPIALGTDANAQLTILQIN